MKGNGINFDWTEERENTLKAGLAEGLSAAGIAYKLGGEITRSAVLGKIHRLGLSNPARNTHLAKTSYAKPKPKLRAKRNGAGGFYIEKVKDRPLPPTIEAPLPSDLVSIIDIKDHQCRFMHGDKFCGRKTWGKSSWCPGHYWVVFDKVSQSHRRERHQPDGFFLKTLGEK